MSKVSLTGRLNTLDKLDAEILSKIEEYEQIEAEIFDAEEFKEVLENILSDIDGALQPQVSNVSENPLTDTDTGETEIQKTKVSCKLPKLSLKRFNGDPSMWMQFWDSFESAVHKNSELSEIDKINYLRGQLEGRALATISSFSLTALNYNVAIELLKDRFANLQIIISSHMEKLLKLQEVSDVNDVKKIRAFYDTFDAVSAIKAIPPGLLDEGYRFVSSDVVSLFTNVPLKRTIDLVLKRVFNEKLINTTLSKSTLKKLISDSCSKTAFSFDNEIYEQIDGVSMGSCLARVLANIILNEFENQIVEDLIEVGNIKFYRPYADDTLVLIKPCDIPLVLKKFNSFDKNLNFTEDEFEDGKVHFLDLEISESRIDVFPKTTHTRDSIPISIVSKPGSNPYFATRYEYAATRFF